MEGIGVTEFLLWDPDIERSLKLLAAPSIIIRRACLARRGRRFFSRWNGYCYWEVGSQTGNLRG